MEHDLKGLMSVMKEVTAILVARRLHPSGVLDPKQRCAPYRRLIDRLRTALHECPEKAYSVRMAQSSFGGGSRYAIRRASFLLLAHVRSLL